jgi:hypothetical protein
MRIADAFDPELDVACLGRLRIGKTQSSLFGINKTPA